MDIKPTNIELIFYKILNTYLKKSNLEEPNQRKALFKMEPQAARKADPACRGHGCPRSILNKAFL